MGKNTSNKAFWKEFIKTYKNLPILWNTKCAEYNNKEKKNNAYDDLLEKYREMDENADVESIKKKINILRTNYRRELQKQIKSMESESLDVYQPSLWYFEDLNFLRDTKDTEKINKKVKEIPIKMTPRKRKSSTEDENKLIFTAYDHLWQRQKDSEADIMAKTWAIEYSKLEPDQQLYAKKAIDDILFEGRLGNLTRNFLEQHFCKVSSPSPPNIYDDTISNLEPEMP